MNKTIESYLLDFKKITKAEQKLTDEEKERFELVKYERVHNQLLNLYPEETLIIEAINPLMGEVIYQSSCGRATINLKSLGYKEEKTERGNDVYVMGPALFEKKH